MGTLIRMVSQYSTGRRFASVNDLIDSYNEQLKTYYEVKGETSESDAVKTALITGRIAALEDVVEGLREMR